MARPLHCNNTIYASGKSAAMPMIAVGSLGEATAVLGRIVAPTLSYRRPSSAGTAIGASIPASGTAGVGMEFVLRHSVIVACPNA